MNLIFVYNANSGTLNALIDSVHKFVNPTTYKCNLCALTFPTFSEDRNWKSFKQKSNLKMEFYHKDEFLKEFKSKWLATYSFPIILSKNNEELEVFISSEELKKIKNTQSLISEITQRSIRH